MSVPSSSRPAWLIGPEEWGRSLVPAVVQREFPAHQLDDVEASWAFARERANAAAMAAGLAPLEHDHWDWRNKAESAAGGHHLLVAVECEREVQGLMAVLRRPRAGHGGSPVLYVDYLEAAPWNLKATGSPPRFIGVGTVLIADAVHLSREFGLGGRVGLHSLPAAEPFYETRCRMTRIGPDPDYYDLTYFEYTERQAADWLAAIGESE